MIGRISKTQSPLAEMREDLSDYKISEQSDIQTLRAAYQALPTGDELAAIVSDGKAAEARGYFDPVEDERLRNAYARYLAMRFALWDIIKTHQPAARRVKSSPETASKSDLRDFAVSFCAAEIIVRTGEYLIDMARERGIIWRKLDEGESRYGIKRKSFTRLYRQLTSAFRMHGFYRACTVFDEHEPLILAAAPKRIAAILKILNLPTASRGDHLRRYRSFVRHSLKRRQLSAWKKILFSAFEMTGSDIADLKIPFVKPPRASKRVTSEIIERIKSQLQPGDIFVTRHDDAMSNLFLPGFWPHSALWLGAQDADILEAKKDGVLLREIEETLQVDSFLVLRPNLNPSQIEKALNRARAHTGKLYDFVFDFRTSDRLVCTEVIYRTYHGIGDIEFDLIVQAGRHCLSAEELINQGLGNGWFELAALYGVGGDELLHGEAAKTRLRKSFESRF